MPIIGFGGGFGGGSSYINGVVPTSADLPTTVGNPPMDSVYLAKVGSGVWLINRKPAGLYCRTANDGAASDWTYLGAFPEVNADGNWELYNTTDPTKELKFDLSGISAGNTRTLTVPNASGVIGIADTRTNVSYSTNQSLPATRNTLLVVSNTNASGINLDLPTTGTNDGDIYTFIGGGTVSGPIIIRRCVLLSPLAFTEIARIAATGQSHSFRAIGSGSNNWELVSANWAVPSAIGSTTRNTGAFTTLSATGAITGAEATSTSVRSLANGFQLPVAASSGAVGILSTFIGSGNELRIYSANSGGTISNMATFNASSGASFTTLSANNGILNASAPVLDLAQTWNASGTTFTGLNFTITDTQSANGSRAFDIKSGTTSIFSLRKVGGAPLTEVVAINGPGRGLIIGSGTLAPSDAFFSLRWQVNVAGLARDAIFAWGTDVYNLSYDLAIQRDAADTLAQRRAANPQTFRLYTTWANNGVDFERLFIKGQTNSAFQIGTEKGGTGGARDLAFLHDGTTRLTINDKIRTGSTSLVLGSASRVEWGAGTIYLEASTSASPAYFKIVTASTDRLNFDASGIIGFGGLTNLFPALKRSSTTLQVRLADDSAFAPFECAGLTLNGNLTASTRNIVTDTTTGTKIGTATNQKIGFFNATPVVQQSGTGTNATGFTANGPTNTVHADSTFTGDVGATAYSISDIVKHLKTMGLIAS
jgi:hypothetical protein